MSCPIALYPATSEREKIHFHQLNRKTGNRIQYKKVDSDTGRAVDKDDIIKAYEKSKGEYTAVEPEELEAVEIETKRTIEIDQFVDRKEIDELYFANPYYIVPDGEAGVQAFTVIRDAIEEEGMIAIGRVVFTSREHVIGLEARGKGIMGITLRYPYEVRDEKDYFGDIPSERVTKDMLDLAKHIIKTKTGHFKPQELEDRYEDALKELLRKKDKGEKIEAPREPSSDNVVNLMDALRRSVHGERAPASQPPHAAEYTSPKERKETLDHSPQKSELAWTQVTPSMMILRQSMADPTSQNGEPSAKKLGTPKAKQSYALGSQNSGQRHRAEGTRAQLHATGRLRKLPAGT